MSGKAYAMAVTATQSQRQVNFSGLPGSGAAMGQADLLLILPDNNGFSLQRYGVDGFVGDTWHEILEDAMDQAAFEYMSGQWVTIPAAIHDPQSSLDEIRKLLKR